MSVGLSLLAAISENGSSVTLRLLGEDMLVGDDELNVYQFMRNHYRRYGDIPTPDTVENDTDVSLPETPERVDYYLDEVHNRHVYTEVRREYGELRTAITESDIDSMLSTAGRIRRICTPYSGQQQELITMADLTDDVAAEYEFHHASPGYSGVPTGFEFLDRETGGYQNGDLVIWVARPAIGKTHLLCHGSRLAWMGSKSVLVVSMEMTLKQMGMRYAAHHGGLNPDMIRKGKLSHWARNRFDQGLAELGAANNFHLFAGNFNKNTDDVDILIQELNPDIIYIDGMYLMTPSKGNARMGRYEKAAYLLDDLKRMALMRDRPIVATTQFGRGARGGGKGGSLENIGYTDAVGTHASIVIAIKQGKAVVKQVRGKVWNEGRNEYEAGRLGYIETRPYRVLEVLKGREGEAGNYGINFAFGPCDFSYLPYDEAKEEEEERESDRPGRRRQRPPTLEQAANMDTMA